MTERHAAYISHSGGERVAADVGIVIVYILVLVGMGLFGGRAVKGADDFAAADKKYGAPVIFASLAASYVGGGFSVGNAAEAFERGVGMTAALLGFGAVTVLVGKYVAPGVRRFAGVSSTGGIAAAAYGKGAGVLVGACGFLCCAGVVGAQMEGMGVTLHTLLGVSPTAGVLIGCGVVLIYSTVGGMGAVIAADMVQFFLLALGMPLLLFAALKRAGGIGAVLAATPPAFFDPVNGRSGAAFLSLFLTMALGEALVPPYTQRLLIGKDLRAASRGTVAAGLFSVPFFVITGLIGLAARALSVTDNAADAMPRLILTVLPVGVRGLVMAAMVSILLSAADGFLNGAAVSLVQDVIAPLCPSLSDKRRLLLLRAVNLLTGGAAVAAALLLPDVLGILTAAYACWSPLTVVPLAAALLGVRANDRTFFAAVFAGGAAALLWRALGSPLSVTGATVGTLANFLVFSLGARRCRKRRQELRLRAK